MFDNDLNLAQASANFFHGSVFLRINLKGLQLVFK